MIIALSPQVDAENVQNNGFPQIPMNGGLIERKFGYAVVLFA
jgi:hypothetical protein